jgi:hypothetical protein
MTHEIRHYADDTIIVGRAEEELRDGKYTVYETYTERDEYRGVAQSLREARTILWDDYNRRAIEGSAAA